MNWNRIDLCWGLLTSNNWGGLYYGDPRNFNFTLRYTY